MYNGAKYPIMFMIIQCGLKLMMKVLLIKN